MTFKFLHQIIPLNKITKAMIASDFFLLLGWGLISPILAIFITQQIKGGDVQVAGTAVGIYWLIKSALQMPIGNYLDKNHGEKDDFYFLFCGFLLASTVPIGYIFSNAVWHIYFLQVLFGLAMAIAIPAWGGIFFRHIDKGKEAFTWGVESSSIGAATAIAGMAGGTIAKIFGFFPLFMGVSIFTIIAALLLLLIRKDLFIEVSKEKSIPIPKGGL